MSLMFQRPFTFSGAEFYPYKINQSCRFNDDDSAYLSWTPGSVGDSRQIHSVSFWIKRCNLTFAMGSMFTAGDGVGDGSQYNIGAGDVMQYKHEDSTVQDSNIVFDPVLRDVTSWMHIFAVYNSTEAVNTDRLKVWYNGVEVFDAAGANYIALNKTCDFSSTFLHRIGRNILDDNTRYGDYYLAEFQFIDGLVQSVSDFGQSKYGIWIPKRYTGTYGTNGFKLEFADSSDLGKDVSGNGNDFTSSGLASNDQVEDSPTNNYATLSSINKPVSYPTSNGNLNIQYAVVNWITCLSTMGFPSTGKWYFEYKIGTDIQYVLIGVQQAQEGSSPITTNIYIGIDTTGWGFMSNGASVIYSKYYNASAVTLTGDTPSTGDVMQLAIDIDAGKIWFGSNNTWLSSGDPAAGTNEAYSGLTGDLVPGVSVYSYTDAAGYINFGQLGFTYTPPTGFKALCSNNLSIPSIKNSSTGFDVITWDGDNVSPRNISGLNFDVSAGALIWTKCRNTAYAHFLWDTVRGAGVNKEIGSDHSGIEGSQNCEAYGYLSAFNNDGFELTEGSSSAGFVNYTGYNYVAWCFRMGAKYGFDIQTYTGTGVAHAENHNLGGAPELMEIKNLDVARDWRVYHHHALNKTDPETDVGYLDLTNAWVDLATPWNDTAPTSTQFTVGTDVGTNENTKNFVAYLWRSIEGFSKVFSYTGNGNADGPFVYCGFRPRYILIKNITVGRNWILFDTARDTYNVMDHRLYADLTNVEDTAVDNLDICSNGFKLRTTNVHANDNSDVHIGIAYAEQPGKWSNAR